MPFSPPYVSAITAGILIIIQMALMYSVVRTRWRVRQSLGDGGKQEILLTIRRHGNLAENAAIFIAGFALLELMGASRLWVAILCAAFVLARISHLVGLSMPGKTVNRLRIAGAAGTMFVGVALGARLIFAALPFLAE
jgi:uncharacterized membrane protein YecN with MAPEG domain